MAVCDIETQIYAFGFTKRDYWGENRVCAMDPKKCNVKL